MTNKFLRHDGIQWNLDGGLVGPPGPAGQNGSGGGGGAASALIYRPGGTAAGSVFTSWTALMTARAAIDSPIVVVIDDSLVSPAVIDIGVWDLTHNTQLVGAKGNQNTQFQGVSDTLTQVSIPDGAQLFNPSYFQDMTITGFATTLFSIDSDAQPAPHSGSMNFTAYNVIFKTGAGANKPLIHTNGGVMDFYGCCHLISSSNAAFIITNTATQPVFINLHDNSVVDGYTLFFSGGTVSVTVNVMGLLAFYNPNQPGVSITVTVNGTATGDLAGVYPGPTVVQITGDGTNVNILCPIQTSTAFVHYTPISAQSSFIATGAFETIYNGFAVADNTGVQVDVILTAMDNSASNFASWKLSFGALKTGVAAAVSVGAVPSPLGVVPDRSTPGASGWLATVILSAGSIVVQGQAVNSAIWGISYQYLTVIQ